MVFMSRWNIFFLLGITFFILFVADTTMPEIQYLVIASMIAFSASIIPFAYEDVNHSEFIIQSLPVTRSEIVLAKYIGVIFNILFGILLTTFLYFLLSIINIQDIYFLKMDLILPIPFIVFLMVSINFPLYFKIGYRKAKLANILVYMALFMGVNLLVRDFEKTSFTFEALTEIPSLNFLIPIGVVIVTVLSIMLSLKLYSDKEL